MLIFYLLLALGCSMAAHKEDKAPGMLDGQLRACPDKPNCINTEYPEKSSQYLPPLDYPESTTEQVLVLAKEIILQMGGEIIRQDKHYLAATFTSSIFRFVDDFEISRNESSHKIHIRSASRVGYSDFGVNKRRVEKFSKLFKSRLR